MLSAGDKEAVDRCPLSVGYPACVTLSHARQWGSPRSTVNGQRSTGITLIELLIVMAIVSLMLGIAYPNVTAGLDGIRLKTTVDRAASFWAEARQRADRYQEVVQVTIDPTKGEIRAMSAHSPWKKTFTVEDELSFEAPEKERAYMLYPGSPSPQFSLVLATKSGGRSGLKVNILTGLPEQWDGGEK